MQYGNLSETYLVTAKIGKAVEYYYFMSRREAERAERKLREQGYETYLD